ncbi:MAG TPA: sigma 54-interacting transcriptional regulator [Blastocatellia bacterium]|nr:sigma 54-interacting transcriptional regulator [Blastocatellia bacterium]
MEIDLLERKLRMYEARGAIFSRISSETFSVINLDHFLRGAVTEVGKMMGVDRSDAITLAPEGVLRITHEYRANETEEAMPSLVGFEARIDIERFQESIDVYNPLVIEEGSPSDLPIALQKIVETIGSRSSLFVPITFNLHLLGLIGLHHCREPYRWSEDEIEFIRDLAQQIAIGYRYTHIYSEKEKEARINKALLEIANDINTGSDFSEVTERILDRALDLLGIQAACLAIIDANNSEIHFTNLRTSEDAPADVLKRSSLKFPILELLPKKVDRGQMLKVLSPDQHEYARSFLTEVFSAGAAIVVPMIVEDKIFGALVLLWAEPQKAFHKEQTALALGMADQLAIAASKARLSAEVLRLRRELEHAQSEHSDIGFVGRSENIMRCMQMAVYVADSYTTVLLQGESGTGKEMMADLIQSRSPRRDKPYIKINCGAIPESLLESELFGHEKGAFTDARARRIGKFEEANGGTLFLDEVAEMSLQAQVRLLRVLQNGEFTRVGSNEVIKTDVRVIAASNVDVEEAVREGKFRRDLFYRLNVYPIKLPPLRERRDDIPLLATHFLEIYNKRSNKNITGITKKAMTWLRRYDWPGNVRELENAIERAVIIAQGRLITIDDLPDAVRGAETSRSIELEVGTTIDEAEKRMILQTLAYTRGDRSRAAQILGIGRKTLYRKLQKYNHEAASK